MMSAAASVRAFSPSASGRTLLALALLISVLVGGRGLSREGSFFLQGDPPRYLLDGVFLYDFLRSGAWWPGDALTFAEHYYARYPALSLGHHPPFLPASLVPFYAVFGISVFSARLAILTFFAIAVLLLYRVATRMYDEDVAGWATVLFASSPIIAQFGQRALSEMPTIMLVLAALNFIQRFQRSGRLRDYLLFIAMAVTSLLCRPTAVYMFPAYAVFVLMNGNYKHQAKRGIAVATLIGAGLFVCAIIGFLALSPFNSGVVFDVWQRGLDMAAVRDMSGSVMRERPLFAVMMAGVVVSILMRDRRLVAPLIWMASVLVCATLFTGSIEPGRYTVPSVPAACVLGASLFAWMRTRAQYVICAALVIVAVTLQLSLIFRRPTWDAPGYEAAARYMATEALTPTVLYSASIDTGYFVFFVRKHDPGQRMVVLRADKLLSTSNMAELSVETLIAKPEEIYPILQRYGTRFVVIEDRESGSATLDWLRDLVRTDQFVERRRFLIGNANPDLNGVSLVVYEYLNATDPAPDAELDLNIPLVGRRIRVPLSDLSTSPQTR